MAICGLDQELDLKSMTLTSFIVEGVSQLDKDEEYVISDDD